MEYVVLGLLHLKVMTIYELNSAFKQGISLFYSASYGSLQVAVKKLLTAGWIVASECVENGRKKKYYEMTPDGHVAFMAWMVQEYPQGNKLEVTLLSKLFFLGLIESKEERSRLIEKMIVAVDEACQIMMQADKELQALPAEIQTHPVFYYQYKTLQYGLNGHHHALEWFKQLLLAEKDVEA